MQMHRKNPNAMANKTNYAIQSRAKAKFVDQKEQPSFILRKY